MTFRFVLLVLALLPARAAAAQEPPAGSSLRSLVDTERAFSKMSVAQGTRAAFLAFFADDGVSFGPEPVNTKKSITSQPAPAAPPAIILEWMPIRLTLPVPAISGTRPDPGCERSGPTHASRWRGDGNSPSGRSRRTAPGRPPPTSARARLHMCCRESMPFIRQARAVSLPPPRRRREQRMRPR